MKSLAKPDRKVLLYRSAFLILILSIISSLFSCEIIADFEYETSTDPPMEALVGEEVKFTDMSKNAKSYKWDFGDGGTSTEKDPTHVYNAPGTYEISLEAIRNDRSDTYLMTIDVTFDLDYFADTWGTDEIPGISVAVLDQTTGAITTHTTGLSHGTTPISTSMLFGQPFQAETFTSVLTMKLVEQELLSLDDPIGEYLPVITHVNPAITIRQLMQHKSGLDENQGEIYDLISANPSKVWTYEDIFSHIIPPNNEPGVEVQHHEINYILLGMILEEVLGKTYSEIFHEMITTPLELNDTFMEGLDDVPTNRAHPWFEDDTDHYNESRVALGTALRSSGALVSTPTDMVKFYHAVFNGGFLSAESLNEITSFSSWQGTNYDMGLAILRKSYNGKLYWFYYGGGPGYRAWTIYDIECGDVINVSVNGSHTAATSHFDDFVWIMTTGLCE